jgi:hypothetical protein
MGRNYYIDDALVYAGTNTDERTILGQLEVESYIGQSNALHYCIETFVSFIISPNEASLIRKASIVPF